MKLRHLLVASLLAIASAGAQAASTLTGPGTPNVLYNGDAASVSHSPGNFTDNWTLVIDESTGAADVHVTFADFPTTFIGLTFDITGMGVSGNPIFIGSNDSWSFSGLLPNAEYNITVFGTAAGTGGGFYSASFNAVPSAAPVPIPPAALLFGSALIGLASLRRRKAAHEA